MHQMAAVASCHNFQSCQSCSKRIGCTVDLCLLGTVQAVLDVAKVSLGGLILAGVLAGGFAD